MPDTKRQAVHLPSDRDHSGRDLGQEELANLERAIRSGQLNCTGGQETRAFEAAFAKRMGSKQAIACASGTAAVHAAIAALGLQAGDAVITTAITDMGAIMPIVYEGAVPVFADVDPGTLNLTADTIRPRISGRSRALIVTHLFGMPCEMAAIMDLCQEHGLVLIEDCAQAFLAESSGKLVGSFGQIATYSFQQGKHMTTGEGGMLTCDDDDLAQRIRRFVNKGWGYGEENPEHREPGLNYRITELQSAVGRAQLAKLDSVVDRRELAAQRLCSLLADLPGLSLPLAPAGDRHSYWRFALRVDADRVPGGSDRLGAALQQAGLHCMPRYIRKPAFDCEVFTKPGQHPVVARLLDSGAYSPPASDDFPGIYSGLEQILVLPWNEHYMSEHIDYLAAVIREAHGSLVS
ncbi:MAG: DegT/DnrJ/EryC1/StrS family aminotransferase [Planctomycetota bacterium]|jgi:dTDP-4-amino-4,6-dideoxygalactose transaminase